MKLQNHFDFVLFCYFREKQPELDMQGPRRDRCVSELVLHWTLLIKDFSVLVSLFSYNLEMCTLCLLYTPSLQDN